MELVVRSQIPCNSFVDLLRIHGTSCGKPLTWKKYIVVKIILNNNSDNFFDVLKKKMSPLAVP